MVAILAASVNTTTRAARPRVVRSAKLGTVVVVIASDELTGRHSQDLLPNSCKIGACREQKDFKCLSGVFYSALWSGNEHESCRGSRLMCGSNDRKVVLVLKTLAETCV